MTQPITDSAIRAALERAEAARLGGHEALEYIPALARALLETRAALRLVERIARSRIVADTHDPRARHALLDDLLKVTCAALGDNTETPNG